MMFHYVVTCTLIYTIRIPFKSNFISLFTLYLFKNLLFQKKKFKKVKPEKQKDAD